MNRLTAACLALLAGSTLAQDRRPDVEWSLPSGTAPCTVCYTSNGAPIAIDLTGASGRFLDKPVELAKFGLRGLACAAVLPDASAAFGGLTNGDVWRWDLATGARTRASSGHGSTVACAAVSPDGRLVATGS